jgi:hypothetical protein
MLRTNQLIIGRYYRFLGYCYDPNQPEQISQSCLKGNIFQFETTGKGTIVIGNGDPTFHPGSFWCVDPNDVHEEISEEEVLIYKIGG